MKKLIFIALCLFATTSQSQYFEGVVEYETKGIVDGRSSSNIYKNYYGGNGRFSRKEFKNLDGTYLLVRIIRNDTLFRLDLEKKTGNFQVVDKSVYIDNQKEFKRTSKTKIIQGVKCVKYTTNVFNIKKESTGYFSENMLTSRTEDGKPNYLMLKQEVNFLNGNSETIATNISEKKLDKSLFTIPNNFTLIDLNEYYKSQSKRKKEKEEKTKQKK